MITSINILLDEVASATKAVSMINRGGDVEIAVSSPTERVVLPGDVAYTIQNAIKEYVDKRKDFIAKAMADLQE